MQNWLGQACQGPSPQEGSEFLMGGCAWEPTVETRRTNKSAPGWADMALHELSKLCIAVCCTSCGGTHLSVHFCFPRNCPAAQHTTGGTPVSICFVVTVEGWPCCMRHHHVLLCHAPGTGLPVPDLCLLRQARGVGHRPRGMDCHGVGVDQSHRLHKQLGCNRRQCELSKTGRNLGHGMAWESLCRCLPSHSSHVVMYHHKNA